MSAPTYDLGKLHGGLRLQGHKQESTSQPILEVPVPSQLVLPIEQHVGEPAQPVVDIGDVVLKGQLIAEPDGELGAPVHASSSGTVVAIESWPVSRRHGDKAPCIVIDSDGKDEWAELPAPWPNFAELDPADLRERIRSAIREEESPRHVPAKILEVTDLPRTRSGKISEIAVRETIHGRPVKNTEALANPEALDEFSDRAELKS